MNWTAIDDTTWIATDKTGDYTITARNKAMFDLTFVSNVPPKAGINPNMPKLSRAQRLGPYTSKEYAMAKADDIQRDLEFHFMTLEDLLPDILKKFGKD